MVEILYFLDFLRELGLSKIFSWLFVLYILINVVCTLALFFFGFSYSVIFISSFVTGRLLLVGLV